MSTLNFAEMNISSQLLKAIGDLGYEEATPIQSQAIEKIMDGRDIIGQSQTGTGKTAAFGIPCIEKIDTNDRSLQALILCPTRELAIQVCEEFKKLLKYKDNLKVLPIYGGQPIDRQINALKKGVQVVIGTPGRVMDHMKRKTIKPETLSMVILDEADEMLDMGFREDIEEILSKTPEHRQTILFSATMAKGILELTESYQNDPSYIKVTPKELTVPSIEQIYYEVYERTKLQALCRIIDMQNPELSIVFCNTKRRVDEVVEQLQGRGYFAEALHGDLKQMQRDTVMKKFRNGTLEILVATDVAARGIDVTNIDIVFNYDIPQDVEYYVHRIGRTGRAGKSGKAFTFVVGKEIYKLRDIMGITKSKIAYQKLPTLSDIEGAKSAKFEQSIKDTIEQGHLTKYINITESLISDEYSTVDICAALMKMQLENDSVEDTLEELDAVSYENRFKKGGYGRDGRGNDSFKRGGRDDFKSKKWQDGKGGRSSSRDDENMVRLFINIGEKHKVRTKDVVGCIAGETGIPGRVIGAIDILDDFTFVDVPKEYSKDIITKMKGKKLKGQKVKIEQAKKKNRKDDK